MASKQHNINDLSWLGPGPRFYVYQVDLVERMSQPFTLEVLLETKTPVDPLELIHKQGRVVVKCGENHAQQRSLSGVIAEVRQVRSGFGSVHGREERAYYYKLIMRPRMWLLTKTHRSKVYQHMSVQAIVSEVLGESGVAFSWRASGGTKSREYCVQYGETNFHFVNRLLEAEGIYYYYDHDGAQTVIADSAGAHAGCSPVATVPYLEGEWTKERDREGLQTVEYAIRAGSAAVMCGDYNYQTSQINIQASKSIRSPLAVAGSEMYFHSTLHADHGGGEALAGVRGDASSAQLMELSGSGNCRSFDVGSWFQLEGHYSQDLNRKWLLTETTIHAEPGEFRVDFRAVPLGSALRPERSTPRPKVQGLQTAVVTGPPGAEVYLDNLGRCKLQFHWDREGPKNDRSSMWVRVANNYSGQGYGIQFIPRVGHEVLVEFLEGNPDHPVLVGRVYNDAQAPPLGPAQKYQNAIKTIKDHHIIFDDTDGKEMFDVRSQKDMTVLVVNDQSRTVGHDQATQVGHDQGTQVGNDQSIAVGHDQGTQVGNDQGTRVGNNQATEVGNDRDVQVGNDQRHSVGNDESGAVGNDQRLDVGNNRDRHVGNNETVAIGNDRQVEIGNNQNTRVGASREANIGNNEKVDIGGNMSLDVGDNKNEQVGGSSTETVSIGKVVTVGAAMQTTVGGAANMSVGLTHTEQAGLIRKIIAGTKLELQCGAAKITLEASGKVTIKGTEFHFESTGPAVLKGSIVDIN
ncbi:Type VI secretion system tip protein VgrG [Sulfidibacter corallicola]|uniref:Type VI secretion system tip protein VgrG n=1 Tax=Sulfidibacter corallicola TaxID=2818388 RepID=A0A8A4TKZ0_SULCO|nr:type VI secretion system tip protein TssI/VgrG [Sulfidibacter corallicola]QTD49518.1 type VI secretion system tip protein VgrG [Sulfidibacter corallicola]